MRERKLYMIDGVSMTLSQWARHLGISRQALYSRLKRLAPQQAIDPNFCLNEPIEDGKFYGIILSQRLSEALTEYAKSHRTTRSYVVRKALEIYLSPVMGKNQ